MKNMVTHENRFSWPQPSFILCPDWHSLKLQFDIVTKFWNQHSFHPNFLDNHETMYILHPRLLLRKSGQHLVNSFFIVGPLRVNYFIHSLGS